MNSDLSVAGVGFRISSPAGPVLPVAPTAYRDFRCRLPDGTTDVEVRLEPRAGLRPRPERPLFDAGNWTIYRDPSGYRLEIGTTTATWNPEASRVTVHCASLSSDESMNNAGRVANGLGYPLDQLILMHHLANRAGLLIHAAGAEFGGRCLLFPGQSGAGKSTLARQLMDNPAPILLSDDRMIARELDSGFHAFGTPWPGDAGIAVNRGAPLAAICFIAHGMENSITRLASAESAFRLIPLMSIPLWDEVLAPSYFATLDSLVSSVPSYELRFAPTPAVAGFLASFASSL